MMALAEMTIEQAAALLGVQAGLLQPFAVADPFHDGLPLEGFLCQKTDHRYGAIVITRVADESCPQLIHATPKLRYPFDRDGRFRFPPIARAHDIRKLQPSPHGTTAASPSSCMAAVTRTSSPTTSRWLWPCSLASSR
jgi:hypothetical protein